MYASKLVRKRVIVLPSQNDRHNDLHSINRYLHSYSKINMNTSENGF